MLPILDLHLESFLQCSRSLAKVAAEIIENVLNCKLEETFSKNYISIRGVQLSFRQGTIRINLNNQNTVTCDFKTVIWDLNRVLFWSSSASKQQECPQIFGYPVFVYDFE